MVSAVYAPSLATVFLPGSLTEISNHAFSACTSLQNIYFDGTQAEWDAVTKGESWDGGSSAYTLHFSDSQPSEDGSES